MSVVEVIRRPVLHTVLVGRVSSWAFKEVMLYRTELLAATLITMGEPPLKAAFAGWAIVTTAGKSLAVTLK